MKKLLILCITAVMMAGCREKWEGGHNYDVATIDSCEYVCLGTLGLAHKGNCRFCAERHKRELKEIVEQLKTD